MKNKGFTLIELLVVITLVAAISVAVGVSMSGMLSRQEEKDYEDYKKILENAACTYAEIHKITTSSSVEIGKLLDEGLLRKDLTNPKNDKKVTEYSDQTVNINWNNYEKTCTYNPTE